MMQACVFQQRKLEKEKLSCFKQPLSSIDLGVYEARLNEPLSPRPSAPSVCNYLNYVGKKSVWQTEIRD